MRSHVLSSMSNMMIAQTFLMCFVLIAVRRHDTLIRSSIPLMKKR